MNLYRSDLVGFAATARGKAHVRAERACQDAHAVLIGDASAIAVCDGCSGGARSELGAGVGARFVVAACVRALRAGTPLDDVPARAIDELTAELGRIASALAIDGGDACERARIVEEHLLFTVQAAVIVRDECVVFGVGDGVVAIDGVVRAIDDGAAPDYPAYALFPAMRAPRLVVHHRGAFASSIVVGSDGARELLDAAHVPLRDGTALGGVDAFVRDERFVRNPSLAQKRFHAWCASEGGGPVDDCTVAVVRRTRAAATVGEQPWEVA